MYRKLDKISIIIANYNGENHLKKCIESVLKSSYSNFELIIIDDCSSDNSYRLLKNYEAIDNRIILLRNSTNLGAAASRNIAVLKVTTEFMMFLDNDTQVRRSWLEPVIQIFITNPQVGAIQSLLLDFNNRASIQMAGGLLIPQTGWLAAFYVNQRYTINSRKLVFRDIVGISAALAVRKKAFDKIGGFDIKESIYTEDLDFCWRLWIAGYSIKLSPASIVYHKTKSIDDRVSMNASNKQIYFHLAKNSFRSIITNYELHNTLKYLPISILINVFRGFLILFKQKSPSAIIATIQATYWILANIKDTLEKRQKVISTRKYKDDYLFDKIFIKDNLIDIYRNYFNKK